ncbi:MAG: hypothetical protein ACPGF8_07605 [Opitutales bacterium]
MKAFTNKLKKFLSFFTLALVLTTPFFISQDVDARMPAIVADSVDAEQIIDDVFEEAKTLSLAFVISAAVLAFIWIGNLYFQGEYEVAVQRGKQIVLGLMVIALAPYIVKFAAEIIGL